MRNFLIYLALTWLSCTPNNKNSNSQQMQTNIQLVEQYFEHFNQHEWQKMANMYTEVCEFKDPSLGTDIVKMSRAEIVTKYTDLNQIFANIKDEIVAIYPSSDKHIIIEFISSGTAPDGITFELPICTIFTIENGKITKDFSYFDNFTE